MTAVLGEMTTVGVGHLLHAGKRNIALVPVGSVEPHGPHLPLLTDVIISEAACHRAAVKLTGQGAAAFVAPAVPYGVTECAAGFAGAISIPAAALTAYLAAVVGGFLAAGFDHVCLVNNHLEPAHDAAVRAAITHLAPGQASVACPLTRKWARTLSDEFKSGKCHAGQYETSLVLAARPDLVDEGARAALVAVDVSLSEKLKAGITHFRDMGMDAAYAGDPQAASKLEGEAQLERLAEMIVGEVTAVGV